MNRLPGDWARYAACSEVDGDLFYPDDAGAYPASVAAAVSVCQRCAVIDACLEYALVSDERFGIWGGLTAHQRRRLVAT